MGFSCQGPEQEHALAYPGMGAEMSPEYLASTMKRVMLVLESWMLLSRIWRPYICAAASLAIAAESLQTQKRYQHAPPAVCNHGCILSGSEGST